MSEKQDRKALPTCPTDGTGYPKWRIAVLAWAGRNNCQQFPRLLEATEDEYADMASANPVTNTGLPCFTEKAKHQRKMHDMDITVGSELIQATEDVDCGVTHIAQDELHQGKGTCILKAMDVHFTTIIELSIAKTVRKITSSRPDATLAPVVSMGRWMTQVLTDHKLAMKVVNGEGYPRGYGSLKTIFALNPIPGMLFLALEHFRSPAV